MTICRIILSFARVCRVGVWFGFVGSALLLAVGTCVVLSFEAMPGLCCFLRVTQDGCTKQGDFQNDVEVTDRYQWPLREHAAWHYSSLQKSACNCGHGCVLGVAGFILPSPCTSYTYKISYKTVQGRIHTEEKRISMHTHGPHATSQPSLSAITVLSHTHSFTAQLAQPREPPHTQGPS